MEIGDGVERGRERGATGRAGVWGRHVKRAGVSPRFYLIRFQRFLAEMTRDRHKIKILMRASFSFMIKRE